MHHFARRLADGELGTGCAAAHHRYLVASDRDLLGMAFAVFLHGMVAPGLDDHALPYHNVAAWLRDRPGARPELAPDCHEHAIFRLGVPWADAVVEFALMLGRGWLAPNLLDGWDYMPELIYPKKGAGERLELTFAIFLNVLRIESAGPERPERIVNRSEAQRRAAQFVRRIVDPSYPITPGFTSYELLRWQKPQALANQGLS